MSIERVSAQVRLRVMPALTVRSQTLKTIVERAVRHEFAVPDMQRDFRWGRERIRSLLASVIAGHPIGVVTTIASLRFDKRAPQPISLMSRGVPEQKVPKQVHVLDGQQRLVALLAGFRGPRGKGGRDSPWFETRVGVYGWRLDLRCWLKLLRSTESRDFQDVRLVERSIRASIRRVSDTSMDEKQSAGDILRSESARQLQRAKDGDAFELPLWYLLRHRNDGSARNQLYREFMDHAAKVLKGSDGLFAILEQRLDDVIEYKVPVAKLQSCTARRAAQIFRRMNQQGLRLTISDLACSQLFLHDAKLRGDMRALQQEADGAPGGAPLSGIYEEDILCVSVCAGSAGSVKPDLSADALMMLAESPAGVRLIRDGFQRFRASIGLSAEILRRCGVVSRDRWPIDSVTLALLAAVAVHQEGLSESESRGALKAQLRRWWWAEHLRQAKMPRRPKMVDSFQRLEQFLRSPAERPSPLSFEEGGLRELLQAPRKPGQNAPSHALTALVECLLRSGEPILKDLFQHSDIRHSTRPLDLHHLFPKAWAAREGIGNVDAIANLTLMSPDSNRKLIRDDSPAELIERLSGLQGATREGVVRLLDRHGVPEALFASGDYEAFIEHRLGWLDDRLRRLLLE